MARPLDLLGRFIKYKVDMGGGSGTGDHGKILTNRTSNAVVNVYNSGLVKTGAPWTFTYLKYVPGAVTVTDLHRPVMTGPLSGCYVFRYTQGGQKLAHVGTAHTATDAGTVAAKKAWKAAIVGQNATNITGSSPFHSFTMTDFQNAVIQGSPQNPICVGYYAGGASYAMLLTIVPASALPPDKKALQLLRVGAIKQMAMQPWANIQNTPKFA